MYSVIGEMQLLEDFFEAIQTHQIQKVKHYLEHNPDLVKKKLRGYFAAEWAVVKNALTILVELDKNGASLKTESLIICALVQSDPAMLEYLSARNIFLEMGITRLHGYACHKFQPENIYLILELLKQTNRLDIYGRSPLIFALLTRQYETAKVLIRMDANTDIVRSYTLGSKQYTLLHVAILHNLNYQFLCENNLVDFNLADKQGFTPLFLALKQALATHKFHVFWDLIKFLKRSDPTNYLTILNQKDQAGYTLLMYLVLHRHTAIAFNLIYKGADIFINAPQQHNLFHLLVGSEIQLKSASPYKETQEKRTAEKFFPQDSHDDVITLIKHLIALGLDINQKNENGLTPLMFAFKNGSNALALDFINNGADIFAQTLNLQNAFHIMTDNPSLEVIQRLINAGLDLYQANKDGYTPIKWAHLTKKNQLRDAFLLCANQHQERHIHPFFSHNIEPEIQQPVSYQFF